MRRTWSLEIVVWSAVLTIMGVVGCAAATPPTPWSAPLEPALLEVEVLGSPFPEHVEPRFQVFSPDGDLVMEAQIGEGALPVPPGRVVVLVNLLPPEQIGPVLLRPAVLTTIRLFDFPTASPPERTWEISHAEGSSKRPFPPPGALPWLGE